MKFKDFLLTEERSDNSGATIKDALDAIGAGLETVRQTTTKENTATSNYKEDGHDVSALWILEDGPMEDEGYSINDANKKLEDLLKAFTKLGGKIITKGSITKSSVIKFNNYNIELESFAINSAKDGSGFKRVYLKFNVS